MAGDILQAPTLTRKDGMRFDVPNGDLFEEAM